LARIATFDDWIDLLKDWQQDIGLDRDLIERFMPGYEFEAKYGASRRPRFLWDFRESGAGESAGDPRPAHARRGFEHGRLSGRHGICVQRAAAVPGQQRAQRVRSRLTRSHHGRRDAPRLPDVPFAVEHFGSEGKIEAQKMLERRAFGKKNRCSTRSTKTSRIGSTSSPTPTSWIATASFNSRCSRTPFRAARPVHGADAQGRGLPHGTGITGLRRIARPASFPWRSSRSTTTSGSRVRSICSARIIRGRRSGRTRGHQGPRRRRQDAGRGDREHLNENARQKFYDEVQTTVDRVNEVNASETKLYVPDMRFNRKIGSTRTSATPWTVAS